MKEPGDDARFFFVRFCALRSIARVGLMAFLETGVNPLKGSNSGVCRAVSGSFDFVTHDESVLHLAHGDTFVPKQRAQNPLIDMA